MRWNSPEQIAAYFDLRDFDEGDMDGLRRSITKKMASVHPDANGIDFADLETKQLWQELQSAKEFVEKNIPTPNSKESQYQLIPLSQVTELIKSITQNNQQPFETRISALKTEAREDARSRGAIPRIGSGVFAAISAFLFTFSSSAKDHPLIGPWLQTTTAQYILVGTMFYAGVFFLMTWTRERRQESLVEFLSSEEGFRETITKLVRERYRDVENPRRFSFRELTEKLMPHRYRERLSPSSMLFGGHLLSNSVAEKIAAIHVERLAKRGLLIELPQTGLDREFEISRSIYDKLIPKR